MKHSSVLARLIVVSAAALALSIEGACEKKPQPVPTPVLTNISVAPSTVVGGTPVQGTVTLSSAPSSAEVLPLQNNNAAATVPASVTVNAGATTGGFTITTSAVSSNVTGSISATLGSTMSASLLVTPPALTANFTVTSLSPAFRKRDDRNGQIPDQNPVLLLPAGTADACPLLNSAVGQILDCRFDGSTSTSPTPITAYVWTYSFGTALKTETSTSPLFQPTASGCGFFGGQGDGSTGGGLTFIGMKVDLQVRDSGGTLSAVKSTQNVRIFPAGQCGYGF